MPLLRPHHVLCSKPTTSAAAKAVVRRRFSAATRPSLSHTFESLAQHLTQTPESQWNLNSLQTLLTSPNDENLLTLTRSLNSSSKSLKLFEFLHSNSPSSTQTLALLYECVVEFASREPGWEKRLLDVYTLGKEKNLSLTENALTVLISRFGKAGMVDQAVSVFDGVDKGGRSTRVCNAMIGVLLRGRRVGDALKVFDAMLERDGEEGFGPDDVTGNLFFRWFWKREREVSEEEVIRLVLKLAECGVFPSSVWVTWLVSTLCKDRMVGCAWDVLCELMRLGGCVEAGSCNLVLTWLGRDGDFGRMSELMVKMKEADIQPNRVTFGILINNLCKSWRVDEALEVLRKMSGEKESDMESIEPDVITYNTVIDGLCKVGRVEEGLGLMEEMRLKKGCQPTVVTYNCLIDGFCKAGEIERASELFDQMNRAGALPNVITLNTLIDGMCKHGRINNAVEFFSHMQKQGLKGNATTYTTLIRAFCSVNNVNEAVRYFNKMLEANCIPHANVYYTLLSSLTQAGRMDDALAMVSKMKKFGLPLDLVCYNQILNGFCLRNKYDKAIEMLNEMEESGVKPDNLTYDTLISNFSQTGKLTVAHRMIRKMVSDGLTPTIATYRALIHGYCLHGSIEEAVEVLGEIISTSRVPPNAVIYNTLIDSLCKNDQVDFALSLMNDMKIKGVKPNSATFNALFKALREKNMLKKALELMESMTKNACKPDYTTVKILKEWLSAIEETEKLKNFLQGFEVSASTV